MPATITGQAAAASSAVTTTVTVTLGSGPTAGETLIAAVGHSDDYPDVPSGWTQVGESVVTGVTRIFTKVASGSEGTGFTFTAPSSGAMSARVLRVIGLGAFHAASGHSSHGTNQTLFGSITTTVADTWLLGATELHATALPSSDITWNSSLVAVAADVKSSGGAKQSMLAVAAKTLSAAATVSGVTASFTPATSPSNNQGVLVAFEFEDYIPPTTAGYASITDSTGWTVVGGSLPAVLSDASDSSYIRSSTNPSSLTFDGLLGGIAAPPSGTDATLTIRPRRNSGTTGSVTAALYDGVTLVSTDTDTPSTSFGSLTFTFPWADISAVPEASWNSGMRLVLTVSAS